MKKGGYKIIDFKGIALSSTAVEIPGILDQIVDNYDKVIMVSGVSLNGELKDDAYASVKVPDGSAELTVYGGIITVTEDDEVTFASSSSVEELAEKIGDLDNLETTDKDSVVDAINEVKGSVEDLADDMFKIATYTASKEIGANGYVNITASEFQFSTPSGYKPLSALSMSTTNATLFVVTYSIDAEGEQVAMTIKNTSSDTLSVAPFIKIVYCKASLFSTN